MPLKWIASGFVICLVHFVLVRSWMVVAREILFVFRSVTAPCRLLTAWVFSVSDRDCWVACCWAWAAAAWAAAAACCACCSCCVTIAQLLPQLLNLGLHVIPQRLNLALHRRLFGATAFWVVCLVVVEEVLVVPVAVVCAWPA